MLIFLKQPSTNSEVSRSDAGDSDLECSRPYAMYTCRVDLFPGSLFSYIVGVSSYVVVWEARKFLCFSL